LRPRPRTCQSQRRLQRLKPSSSLRRTGLGNRPHRWGESRIRLRLFPGRPDSAGLCPFSRCRLFLWLVELCWLPVTRSSVLAPTSRRRTLTACADEYPPSADLHVVLLFLGLSARAIVRG